jgi:hypothetical protein
MCNCEAHLTERAFPWWWCAQFNGENSKSFRKWSMCNFEHITLNPAWESKGRPNGRSKDRVTLRITLFFNAFFLPFWWDRIGYPTKTGGVRTVGTNNWLQLWIGKYKLHPDKNKNKNKRNPRHTLGADNLLVSNRTSQPFMKSQDAPVLVPN